uniref:Uncharacterized protein n=1 Tax=Onchocerca volvulus TaxID=6282 RepID=A0A8R1TW40_ONCVO
MKHLRELLGMGGLYSNDDKLRTPWIPHVGNMWFILTEVLVLLLALMFSFLFGGIVVLESGVDSGTSRDENMEEWDRIRHFNKNSSTNFHRIFKPYQQTDSH